MTPAHFPSSEYQPPSVFTLRCTPLVQRHRSLVPCCRLAASNFQTWQEDPSSLWFHAALHTSPYSLTGTRASADLPTHYTKFRSNTKPRCGTCCAAHLLSSPSQVPGLQPNLPQPPNLRPINGGPVRLDNAAVGVCRSSRASSSRDSSSATLSVCTRTSVKHRRCYIYEQRAATDQHS
jgi:hypothetical protein